MEFPANPLRDTGKAPHYYGDQVRILFTLAAVLMMVGLPFFRDLIALPSSYSIAAIILLVFLAGLTNPRQIWIVLGDLVVALGGVLVFEYYALKDFSGRIGDFFLVNQLFAAIFLLAFYFAVKSLRGFYLRNKP